MFHLMRWSVLCFVHYVLLPAVYNNKNNKQWQKTNLAL